jgi:AcrR family transcriptional regulator
MFSTNSNKKIPDARKRILEAAKRIFAERSFEGSRIDSIAKAAGVPKSLIYYHFRSKGEILEVLFKEFLDDFMEVIRAAELNSGESYWDEITRRPARYINFMIGNQDLIRVIFIDSLKKSSLEPVIFSFAELMIDSEEKLLHNERPGNYDRDDRLVGEFFTHIIPMFSFLCYYYTWLAHFRMDGKRFEDLFTKIMEETHGNYHNNRRR